LREGLERRLALLEQIYKESFREARNVIRTTEEKVIQSLSVRKEREEGQKTKSKSFMGHEKGRVEGGERITTFKQKREITAAHS